MDEKNGRTSKKLGSRLNRLGKNLFLYTYLVFNVSDLWPMLTVPPFQRLIGWCSVLAVNKIYGNSLDNHVLGDCILLPCLRRKELMIH